MKHYTKKAMEQISGVEFASHLLENELNNQVLPGSAVAAKLRQSMTELEILDAAKMTYAQLKSIFLAWEHQDPAPTTHLTGYIVFKQSSFTQPYTLRQRTYAISSGNKAFMPKQGGYSIFASCMDGTDHGVRLEQYMNQEHGGKDGWEVDYCVLLGPKAD